MTRDEILSMESGREMDALVAEKVMGWISEYDHWWKDNEGTHAGWLVVATDENASGGFDVFAPSYSIAAAWDVLVHMENDDWWWEAANVVPNSDPIVYEMKWSKRGRDDIYVCEDSFPLAICRAALLAVMEADQ